MKTKETTLPLLSILVAAYNAEKYIAECIDSLLAQTYPNTEIIIVDDGSTDSTPSILEKYSDLDNVKVIRKENGGTGTTRNMGLKLAQGDFITFMDADDVIDSNTYKDNIEYLLKDEEVDMVQFPLLFGWTTEKPYKNEPLRELISKKEIMYLRYMQNLITFSMCDKIYRSSAIIGKLTFPEGMLYEDMDTNNQLIHLCRKIQLSQKGCYYYRRTENSNTTHKMHFKKLHDYFLQTFNFLKEAQQCGVNKFALNLFLVRWLRIPELGYYEELKPEEQVSIRKICQQVYISRSLITLQLITGKISLRKFLSLLAFSKNDIQKALVRSRRK